jgi:hypothetical protein
MLLDFLATSTFLAILSKEQGMAQPTPSRFQSICDHLILTAEIATRRKTPLSCESISQVEAGQP